MTIIPALRTFFGSEVGLLVQAVAALALVDFALGVFAAWRDGSFDLARVAAWVRKHIAGRVLPIWTFAFIGYVAAQPALLGMAATMGAAYVAETIGSLRESWAVANKPGAVASRVPVD